MFWKTSSAFICLTLISVSAAFASSEAAWVQFGADVRAKCTQAVSKYIVNPKATVDPYGSQSYGLALVSGKSTYNGKMASFICVYDKKTKKVEIGTEMQTEAPAPKSKSK